MLEKYLNKEVIIEEKLYNSSSTFGNSNNIDKLPKISIMTLQNRISGKLTAFDDDYIELDNEVIVNRKHIYRIILM